MARPRVTVLTDTTRAVERAFAMFTGPLQCAAVSPPAARGAHAAAAVVALPNAELEFVSDSVLARFRRFLRLPTHGAIARVAGGGGAEGRHEPPEQPIALHHLTP